MQWTTELTRLDTDIFNASFIAPRDKFIYGGFRGYKWVKKMFQDHLGGDVVATDEVIYKHTDVFQEVKDSKILVIGAGPTTNCVNWNPDDYDLIWSCNYFFNHPRLSKIKVSFATTNVETVLNPTNKTLYEYLKKYKTVCCMQDDTYNYTDLKAFFKTFDNSIYWSTRYFTKMGSIPRLLCIASYFGAKEIHVVGMDGYPQNVRLGQDSHHAFEPGKRLQGTWDYSLYKRLYLALWDYLLHDVGKHVKFQNLGEGHSYNMSTEISSEYFPLELKYKSLQEF